MRKRHGIGRIALPYPNIEMVQRTGLDANQHILWSDGRHRQIFIRKIDRSTMCPKQYCFHRISFLHAGWLVISSDLIYFLRAGCSKRPFSKAAGESKPEAYPQGYVEDFDEPRTKLADFFSALLRTTVGTSEGLLKHRAEAEVGNGIFEVGIEPLEGSHVGVGDVFHR